MYFLVKISPVSQLRCLCTCHCLPQSPRPNGPPRPTNALPAQLLANPPPDVDHLLQTDGPFPVL